METIAAVVPIVNEGGDAYAQFGIGRSTGTKLISAAGNINKPGVYEINMGITVEEFIYSDTYCGGMKNGKSLKLAYLEDLQCQFYRTIWCVRRLQVKID